MSQSHKSLPPKPRRSHESRIASTQAIALDPKKCEVQPPKLFVELESRGYFQRRYAPAKIRIRRGCYRYLVWRDGFLKREFYLGKVKLLTPQKPRAGTAAGGGAASCRRTSAGVQK
jgi:hypothetical protein